MQRSTILAPYLYLTYTGLSVVSQSGCKLGERGQQVKGESRRNCNTPNRMMRIKNLRSSHHICGNAEAYLDEATPLPRNCNPPSACGGGVALESPGKPMPKHLVRILSQKRRHNKAIPAVHHSMLFDIVWVHRS